MLVQKKTPIDSEKLCIHCNNLIPPGSKLDKFCCRGCQYVYQLIHNYGLDRFHKLKPQKINPLVNYFSRTQDYGWIETVDDYSSGEVRLNIEGVQCSACVWLIGQLSYKHALKVSVSSVLGQITVEFNQQTDDLKSFLKEIDRFGYPTRPANSEASTDSSRVLLRLGICAAIAMNSMMLSIAFYAGLDATNPTLYSLFRHLNFFMAIAAVAVGGSYFFSRAWQALRSRVAHFDLPIALGILVTFLGSTWAHLFGRQQETYFDTLSVFIVLMLLGRFLQQRMVEKNRSAILEEAPLTQLQISRVSENIEEIYVTAVTQGDRLLLQPGTVAPVASVLLSNKDSDFRLDWCSGESTPKTFRLQERIPAGAKLIGSQAVEIRAMQDFKDSPLLQLSLGSRASQQETHPRLWQNLSRWYVAGVLLLALAGLLAWSTIDMRKALEVAIAVAVVTCPCGIGIAIPMARILAAKRLLADGVFQRDLYLLERLQSVKKVLLDKTGTLTLADLKISNPSAIDKLSAKERSLLFNATARSRHPASQAIYRTLLAEQLPYIELEVMETPGLGLQFHHQGFEYTLGRAQTHQTALVDSTRSYDVLFQRQDQLLIQLALEETLLEGAQESIEQLHQRALEVFLISGDKEARVQAMAKHLNIPTTHTYGGQSPTAKAQLVESLENRDTLYLGDGLNDAGAFNKAYLTGAPVWENSSLANVSDFHFISNRLDWLPTIFRLSRLLRKTIRFNFIFAAFYNTIAISLALSGIIGPLVCAVIMPLSSLLVVSATLYRMNQKLI